MAGIINEKSKKIKENFVKKIKKQCIDCVKSLKSDNSFFILLLIFSSSVSFFLGKISVIYDFENKKNKEALILQKSKNEKVELVGSKKGKTYHFPWCFGAMKMSEENKIFFKSKRDAESAGYRPAKNCEGL